MKRLALVMLVCAAAQSVVAATLIKVNVSAPQVNYVFSPTGTITVSDFSAPIWGPGFLQSRTYRALPGSPAAGLWVYEYRIDLTQVVGITSIPYITSLKINFGPVVSTLDYNGDHHPDQVFVTTQGGLGNVNPQKVVQNGNWITIYFNPPVGGGAAPGKGDTTYFIGLVSKYKPKKVTATAANSLGAPLTLQAMAPAHP